MGAVDVYCWTPQGVIDERWIWVFVEVAYIGLRFLCKIASVPDSVGSINIIVHF